MKPFLSRDSDLMSFVGRKTGFFPNMLGGMSGFLDMEVDWFMDGTTVYLSGQEGAD